MVLSSETGEAKVDGGEFSGNRTKSETTGAKI